MALSKSEIALYAFITGRVLPKGTTRAAFRTAVNAVTAVVPRVAPPVARGAAGVSRAALGGAATFARRNPAVATGLGLAAAQQAGVFDPVEEEIRARVDDAVQRAMAPVELAQTDMFQSAAKNVVKRKVSKYSKAVKAGMAAVKKSKFGGKPGTINNAKTVFSTVNKVTSAINKGKKVAKSGIRGTIGKAVRGILK